MNPVKCGDSVREDFYGDDFSTIFLAYSAQYTHEFTTVSHKFNFYTKQITVNQQFETQKW